MKRRKFDVLYFGCVIGSQNFFFPFIQQLNMKKFVCLVSFLAILSTSCASTASQSVNASTSLQTDNSVSSTAQNGQTNETDEIGIDENVTIDDDPIMVKARQFVPDTTPLPELSDWFSLANNGDVQAIFIVSMMYRDQIGVKNIKEGKLSKKDVDEVFEKKRWLQRASNSSDLLSELSVKPSLNFSDENIEHKDVDKSLPWLEDMAKRGLPNAEFVLGLAYYNGVGVSKDTAKGLDLIAQAASHQVSLAQYYIGMMYEQGMGMPVDKARALAWFKEAAKNQSPDAAFVLALKYLDGIDVKRDPVKAENYRLMQLKFHVWSQMLEDKVLGEFGRICKFDFDTGELGYEFADGCDGEGDYWNPNLSEKENERIIEEMIIKKRVNTSIDYAVDYALAAQWMKAVTSQNRYIRAMILWAQILINGGCNSHDDDAFEIKAKKVNDIIQSTEKLIKDRKSESESDELIGLWYFTRASFDIYHSMVEKIDDKEAEGKKILELLQISADHHNKSALKILADYYADRSYPLNSYVPIEEDLEKAIDYYMKLNAKDDVGSMNYIIAEYKWSKENYKEAVSWYKKAAEYNHSNALLKLGQIYVEGKLVSKDDDKAVQCFKKVVENNDLGGEETAVAAKEIGNIYKSSRPNDAMYWYRFAYKKIATYWNYEFIAEKHSDLIGIINKIKIPNGLLDAINHQIELEKGKDLKEFYSYTAVIHPYEKHPYIYPEQFHSIYDESVKNAIRGITALVLAKNGSADTELIKNTFYKLAVFELSKENYFEKMKQSSPVAARLESIFTPQRKVFLSIWYLRQIPYAAKEIYETRPDEKKWDDWLSDADKVMKNAPELLNNLEYDPFEY